MNEDSHAKERRKEKKKIEREYDVTVFLLYFIKGHCFSI